MSRSIEPDYDQELLFPPRLEDFVSAEHAARFIREFVSAVLSSGVTVNWGSPGLRGQPHYSPRVLLGIWLYGYFRGIRSTRRLEEGCKNDVGMIWLCGNRAPDHNTLWRFFDRNREVLGQLFKQTVKVAVKADLVGFVLHALDGTKIQAHVAGRSGYHRKALLERLGTLDERIAAIEAEVDAAHSAEAGEPSADLPEHLHSAHRLRETIHEALAELDEAQTNHLHPGDPDARVMKCSDRKMNAFAYNNQAVVDEQSRLIVAERATQEANDTGLLSTMVQCVEDECGQVAETTVADTGYAAIRPLHEAQQAGHNVLINLPNQLKPDPSELLKTANFRFDADRNVMVCPLGQDLVFTHTRWHSGKSQHLRSYHCKNKDCPLRGQCSKDPKGRRIELLEHHEALQAQRDAHTIPGARQTLAKRRYIVEPVFGWIKQHSGFRRFTVTGIEKVQAQWSLVCAAYNLNLLYNHWKNGKLPIGPHRKHNGQPPRKPWTPLLGLQWRFPN